MNQIANKVTVESITDRIAGMRFTRLPDQTTTICSIIMVNGFVVNGISNCDDPANFNQQIGEQEAYKRAFNQLWELEGYLLKEKLYREAGEPIDITTVDVPVTVNTEDISADMLDSIETIATAEDIKEAMAEVDEMVTNAEARTTEKIADNTPE